MRARDLFLALLIIGSGMLITASHRGALSGPPWFWEGLDGVWSDVDRNWGDHAGWTAGEPSTTTLPVEGETTLAIENRHGRISVMPGPAGEVQVEVVRYGRGLAPGDRDPRAPRLEVTRADKTLDLTVTTPPDGSADTRLDLRVHAPEGLAVETR